MGSFLFTPTTRFYAEALEYMKNAGGKTAGRAADGQTGGVGSAAWAAGSFVGTVQEQLARKKQETGGVSRVGDRNEQAVQAMSGDEYRLYIYQKIAGIPMNPSQKWDAVSVNISEKGFAAMQADPAYEKWVLNTLRQDFSYYNPWSAYAGGSYRVHYFGATKEEYRGESFPMGFRNGGKHTDSAKKKQKSFWEKRAERHKLYMDLATKTWFNRENERKFQEKVDFARKDVSSAVLKQQSIERATGEKAELEVNPAVLSEAATEFAQDYVFFKIPSALMNPKVKGSATK